MEKNKYYLYNTYKIAKYDYNTFYSSCILLYTCEIITIFYKTLYILFKSLFIYHIFNAC